MAEEGVSVIVDAPPLDDVMTINKVLESLGAGITYQNDVIEVDATNITSCEAPYEWVRKNAGFFPGYGPTPVPYGAYTYFPAWRLCHWNKAD
ncbi:hypothetical protein ACFTAO_43910 [Paenibacillus rhizoplanae]